MMGSVRVMTRGGGCCRDHSTVPPARGAARWLRSEEFGRRERGEGTQLLLEAALPIARSRTLGGPYVCARRQVVSAAAAASELRGAP